LGLTFEVGFPLAVVITSFGDIELFIVIYMFSLRESGRLFAQPSSTSFKVVIYH
jgi:hypothetical protein